MGDNQCVLAVDVGGTSVKGELLDEALVSLGRIRRPTEAGRGTDVIVENILGVAAELARSAPGPVLATGLALPGVVDAEGGIGVWSANLGWADVPMRDLATARLGMPVAVGHDMALAGLAEARLGAGKGVPDQLFVGIGTGISGAIMAGGHPITVGNGEAGEIGHVVVRPDGPLCGCGAYGCLEAISSAASIGRRYTAMTGQTATADEVVARLGHDEAADQIWGEAVAALAHALITYVRILAPTRIVLGGGLAEAGAALFDPVRAAMAQQVGFQTMPELVPAELGTRAGTIGSGLLAWDTAAAHRSDRERKEGSYS